MIRKELDIALGSIFQKNALVYTESFKKFLRKLLDYIDENTGNLPDVIDKAIADINAGIQEFETIQTDIEELINNINLEPIIKTNYGLVDKVATIDKLTPNTLYIYTTEVSNLVIQGKDTEWKSSSICHIQFTADSASISVTLEDNTLYIFNSSIVPITGKKHEVNVLGNSVIICVEN